MKRFYFEKLVRDKIIKRNSSNPDVLHTEFRVLSEIEYRKELVSKIKEESDEIPVDGSDRGEALKEVADLQAVVDALRVSLGISEDELRRAIEHKSDEAGGFMLKHYIEYVEISDKSRWVEIFRAQPEKYREEDV